MVHSRAEVAPDATIAALFSRISIYSVVVRQMGHVLRVTHQSVMHATCSTCLQRPTIRLFFPVLSKQMGQSGSMKSVAAIVVSMESLTTLLVSIFTRLSLALRRDFGVTPTFHGTGSNDVRIVMIFSFPVGHSETRI